MTLSAADNITLSNLKPGVSRGLLWPKRLVSLAAAAATPLAFPVRRLSERADRFSGWKYIEVASCAMASSAS